MAHGTGALPSPTDERDWYLPTPAAAAAAGAASGLSAFRLGNRPPLTDQLITPHCVAYSIAYEQNWQDYVEHGRFYNFNEPTFFYRIGGNASGAFARAGLDELIGRGYPEQDSTPSEASHQARVYTRVTQSVQAVKNAIVACGGVLGVGPWYDNWTEGLNAKAVLPTPSGGSSGHMVWYVGWDEYGILGQNSWGSAWGDGGLFRMPWWVFSQRMSEVWTTLDEVTSGVMFNRARIPNTGVYIRFERTLSAEHLRQGQLYAQTRKAGIMRLSDNAIVAKPHDRWFRFGGFRRGPRHGIGSRPTTWARLYIGGAYRVVPAPFVKVDWAP